MVITYAQKAAFASAKSTQGEHPSYLGLLLPIGTTKVLAHFPT